MLSSSAPDLDKTKAVQIDGQIPILECLHEIVPVVIIALVLHYYEAFTEGTALQFKVRVLPEPLSFLVVGFLWFQKKMKNKSKNHIFFPKKISLQSMKIGQQRV